MNHLKFAALAAAVMSVTCMGAMADTVTDIDLSGHVAGNWGTYTAIPLFNGADIAAASTNGNQGTGLTFANWNGDFDLIGSGASDTITFANPVALNSEFGCEHTRKHLFRHFRCNRNNGLICQRQRIDGSILIGR
jgi:hypothetical protein